MLSCLSGARTVVFSTVLTVAVCSLLPSPADATSDHDATGHKHTLVQQLAERGVILGKGTLAIGADLLSSNAAVQSYAATVPLRFGVTDKIDIFLNPRLQTVEPKLSDPAVGATYRIRDGLFEIGATASLQLAVFGPVKSAGLTVGAPLRMHFRENLALDATPSLTVMALPDTTFFLSIPLAGHFNLTDAIGLTGEAHLSMRSGSAGFSGLVIGGSWTGATDGKPWLEIGGRMAWLTLVGGDAMQMMLFARFYAVGLGKK